jgi:hypothetical protein
MAPLPARWAISRPDSVPSLAVLPELGGHWPSSIRAAHGPKSTTSRLTTAGGGQADWHSGESISATMD